MKRIAALVVSALLVLPIAALSRAPYYTPPGAGDALLRFSWRMSIASREECRPRTQEELDALPVHMRTPEVCTPDRASYVLVTRIDGGRPDTLPLLRGGVKGDRPLFVLEDRRLPPGDHGVYVALLRLRDSSETTLASLDTVLRLDAGMIRLITLDAAGALVLR
jgi:hypothetical protein